MVPNRFNTGLILGLVIGLPVGLLIGLQVLPQRPDPTAVASLEVQDLRRKLETATYAKERAERQMEQFQKLAEQMTASFARLEERFKTLGDQAEGAALPAPTPPATQAPPDTP